MAAAPRLPKGNNVGAPPDWAKGPPAPTAARAAGSGGNGTTGITGVISAANSLVGSFPGDAIGGGSTAPNNTGVSYSLGGGVVALPNGNYLVDSPAWDALTGAVTWVNGATAITGTIS